MTYRDDLAALSARHAALEHEVAQKTRELDHAGRLLDEARAKSKLPVLDNIDVAAPCSADWSAMSGDERTRHCGDCKTNVYNLSNLTREEATALVQEKNGDLCVRYFQRADGTIITKDCAVGIARRRRRRVVLVASAAAVLGGAALFATRLLRDDGPEQLDAPEIGLTSREVIEVELRAAEADDAPEAPRVVAPEPVIEHVKMGRFVSHRDDDDL